MGVYPVACNTCNKFFLWFSGNTDQRCAECIVEANNKIVDEFMPEHRDLSKGMTQENVSLQNMKEKLFELHAAHGLIGRLIKELENEIENHKT